MIYMSPEEVVRVAFDEIEQERRLKVYQTRFFWIVLFTLILVPCIAALFLSS